MPIQDRIRELRRVRAGELIANEKNWRTHNDAQRAALKGILDDVGFADALLAREAGDGRLVLIDGHLRAATAPDELVPVLVLDVTEAEADKLLLALDPLSAMAGVDASRLSRLLDTVGTPRPGLRKLFDSLRATVAPPCSPPVSVPSIRHVIAECASEDEQRRAFDALSAMGVRCRVVTL